MSTYFRELTGAVTPERVAFMAWLVLMIFLGDRIAIGVTQEVRGDPVYFCQYAAACKAGNAVDKRCCRDVDLGEAGAENRTSLYTCRPACGR